MEKERYWTFIIYPESLPEDWKETLQQTGLQIAISPLHDKDLNADGELKKPHYHVVLFFQGPTTYNRVEKITNSINGTIPKRVISPIGIIRYLTHKDNPEKFQYDERDLVTLNGLDLNDYCGMTTSMEIEIKRALIKIIIANKFTEYSQFINYLNDNDMVDMFKVASSNTMFFNSYLKSYKFCSFDSQ